MATLTIHLDEETLRRLQARAAQNGRTVEAELQEAATQIAPAPGETPKDDVKPLGECGLGTAIHDLFAPYGGIELELPSRKSSFRTIDFE